MRSVQSNVEMHIFPISNIIMVLVIAVIYITVMECMATFNLTAGIVILKIHHKDPQERPTGIWRKLLNRANKTVPNSEISGNGDKNEIPENTENNSWATVAKTLDKYVFILSSSFVLLCTLSMVIMMIS